MTIFVSNFAPPVAIALVVVSALSVPAARAQAPQTPPVDVAMPLVRTVTDFDTYTGRFEAVERVELRARVAGYLDHVGFEDGETVEQGSLLFRIDRRPFEAVVARAEAALAAAKASRDLAMIELDRAETLAQRNVGTVQEVDRARASVAEAEAQVQVAEAELRSAELDLAFTEIRAPFTGRISDRKVDPGNLIAGGSTQPTLLAVILSTDPIYFSFTVSEADFLRYVRLARAGSRPSSRTTANPVSVRLMDEDSFRHEGVMEFVNNELDPNSGTMTGRAVIANETGFLVPGTFGRIRLPGSGPYEAMLIPEEAVLSDQARKIVLVVDGEGKVGQRQVTVGPMYQGLRVVRDGLKPDDKVIVAGVQRARAGQSVTANEVPLSLQGE
ncbi:MAG: efflux RND transporter periplasmic adaptor subunit [Paracoccaceae bacterium]|nr:efflux RND transporter periplasmic adaptor subunit [Paracoccaceae bacterium]